MNETLNVLKNRRSIRKYKPEQISDAELNAILEAGTWAPTGMGLQSPIMVVVQDAETIAYLSKLNAEVMGNLMNAAESVGVGSCWINRATEVFDQEEGKALLRKWGIDEKYRGVGNCILGYADGEAPAPKERKADYIVRV
ncbi:MAG: nitroreductase family protein [Lachnospiraceae bacterium]|nr:nitroreductase family protein [Lachnospiraceae bacterium]